MGALTLVFWSSLGALAWTHGGYPAALTALARMRGRPVRKAEGTPTVSVIVPAHDEEAVIERRVGNLLELDYPPDRVEIVVSSDASTDRTDELRGDLAPGAARAAPPLPRGGKVAAQNLAVRETTGQVVAFSDANATWDRHALRKLVRNFADPGAAYVCGRMELTLPDGSNREAQARLNFFDWELRIVQLLEVENARGHLIGQPPEVRAAITGAVNLPAPARPRGVSGYSKKVMSESAEPRSSA
jgi:glycosyltransferase involved in cell wall biosynthesis